MIRNPFATWVNMFHYKLIHVRTSFASSSRRRILKFLHTYLNNLLACVKQLSNNLSTLIAKDSSLPQNELPRWRLVHNQRRPRQVRVGLEQRLMQSERLNLWNLKLRLYLRCLQLIWNQRRRMITKGRRNSSWIRFLTPNENRYKGLEVTSQKHISFFLCTSSWGWLMKRSPGQRRKEGFHFFKTLWTTVIPNMTYDILKFCHNRKTPLIRWMASQERSDVIASMPESEAKRRRYI